MKTNIGSADRIIRFVAGALLLLAPFVSGIGLFAYPLAMWGSVVVGLVLIATAIVRFCPLYAPFGLSTCKVTHK